MKYIFGCCRLIILPKNSENIGIIKIISYLLSHKILLVLYYSMIYLYLSFVISFEPLIIPPDKQGSRFFKRELLELFLGQNIFHTLAFFFVKLGLLNLKQITSLKLLHVVFMYKAMNNLLPSDFLKITNLNSDQDRYNIRNGEGHFLCKY